MCKEGAVCTVDWQTVLEALGLDGSWRLGWLELLNVLSVRDAETAHHCFRVAAYCMRVAPALGLTAEERYTLFLAARLHDVGKMLLSPTLLQKPGHLTPAEWALVRKHSELGECMAAMAGLDPEICRIIRHHHERWNGEGYPDGLKEHHTPKLARILATADAFDAMTQARPYRMALTFESAMLELQLVSGTQLDPAVVAAFLTLSVQALAAV